MKRLARTAMRFLVMTSTTFAVRSKVVALILLACGLLPSSAQAGLGETVYTKFTWLLDNVEVVGTVAKIGQDDFGLIPDPNYKHLILYMRGNNPLQWDPIGTPGLLHLEAYPLGENGKTINRNDPWTPPKKPADQEFQVKLRDGSSRPLQVGDKVKVVGRWVIDHHPEYCDKTTPSRCIDSVGIWGIHRIGQTHVELHPFYWEDIQLVEPATWTDTVTAVVSLAAPLYEQQYLGGWKWFHNEITGVAGKVFIGWNNYHTEVGARVELAPPPPPPGLASDWRLEWTETVLKLGAGMSLGGVRTITPRDGGGIVVEATIAANNVSINDPANDRWVFQTRYALSWVKVSTPTPPPGPTPTQICIADCAAEQDVCMQDAHSGPERGACVRQYNACSRGC